MTRVVLATLAIVTALAFDAGAQWRSIEAPVRVGPAVATGVPGEIAIGSLRATRGNVLSGDWTASLAEFSGIQSFISLVASPDAPRVLYAVVPVLAQSAWRSVDGGVTWHELKTPPRNSRLSHVAPGPHASGLVFAFAAFDTRSPALYSSRDGGISWATHDAAADPRSACIAGAEQAPYIRAVLVHPQSPSVVVASMNCGFARSDDGGATWRLVRTRTATDFTSLTASKAAGDRMYASRGGAGGLRSLDGGLTWESTGVAEGISTLFPDPAEGDTVWAASTSRQIYKSTDAGTTWSPTLAPIDGALVFPGGGEIVATNGSQQPSRWNGQRWEPLGLAGGATQPLVSLARSGNGTILAAGTAFSTSFTSSAAITYRKRAGGSWEALGASASGFSFATDSTTGTLYGLQIGRIGFIGLTSVYRFNDDAIIEQVVGGLSTQSSPLVGVRTEGGITRAAIGCSSGGAGGVCIVDLPFESLPPPVVQFPGEGVIGGDWSARGVLTVLTIGGLYRDNFALARWTPGAGPRSMAVHPDNARWLFLAWPDGIQASFDAGASWVPFEAGGTIEKAVLLATPEGLYASNARGMFFCPAYACAGAQELPSTTLVELHHAQRDEYFLSMNPAEVQQLVASNSGWSITGESIRGLAIELPETKSILRFVGVPGIRPDSHFFTVDGSLEVPAVHEDPGWIEEKSGSAYVYPTVRGVCERGTPVYRTVNGRNHRLVPRRDLYDAMVSRGWLGVGVAFCAP